jgi:peptidyl-prolyl cis-trans isomerase B (cyclophilin B)
MFIAAGQNIEIDVDTTGPVDIVMIDFIGRATSARTPRPVSGRVNVLDFFREPLSVPGTYLLAAVSPGAEPSNMIGSPVVLEVREDRRRGAPSGPMLYRLDIMQYAVISTTSGEIKVCFYYDTAPNTVAAIQRLMSGGFYDGLDFFRVEPGFVIQTGDPRNNGTGGPGFNTPAEFSDRQHLEGVLSMARIGDPNEAPGLLPRPEFANSAGSQFFICLDYASTKQLDRRYTAFGRVVEGMEVVKAIAAMPLEANSNRPVSPPKITGARLVPVTAADNPYSKLRVVETSEIGALPVPAGTTEPPPTVRQPRQITPTVGSHGEAGAAEPR